MSLLPHNIMGFPNGIWCAQEHSKALNEVQYIVHGGIKPCVILSLPPPPAPTHITKHTHSSFHS